MVPEGLGRGANCFRMLFSTRNVETRFAGNNENHAFWPGLLDILSATAVEGLKSVFHETASKEGKALIADQDEQLAG